MPTERRHWLIEVANGAGLSGAETLDIPPGTTVSEAWARTREVCGVTTEQLVAHVARRYGLQEATLDNANPTASRLLPEKIARQHGVFPVNVDDRSFFVATADPTNISAEQDVAFATGRTALFTVASPEAIANAITGVYGPDFETLTRDLPEELAHAVEVVEELGPEKLDAQEVESAPVVRLTNIVLRDAVRARASDVHFEPGRQGGTVRFRVDGVMRVHNRLPMHAMNRIVSRIKVMARLDIADRLRPQDGRARIVVESRTVDLRVSTVPTRDAEKAVLRILAQSASQCLADILLPADDERRIHGLVSHRDGIVIVTGPTGSGKSTTLYAMLREIATGEVNVMTVEDPIEYEIPGVTQIQVEPRRKVTFPSALRAILRQDPDVVLVGEVRDLETARVALHASMTGHLVLTTLHTNDAVSAIARLLDLGVDRSGIATAVRGVVAQRLVRRLCPDCVTPVAGELDAREAELAARLGVRPKARAVGCGRCGNTGYEGRLPITEVLTVEPELTEQIAVGASTGDLLKVALKHGLVTLRESALARVKAGETTLEEVDRVLGERLDAPAPSTPEKPADQPAKGRKAKASRKGEAAANPTLSRVRGQGRDHEGGNAILVVDDDAVHRGIARRALERNGFQVHEAESGSAALELVTGGTPVSLVLTDLHMPGLGGRELLSCIRAMPHTAGIPIVIATSEEDDQAEIQLIEAGADDYIRKPIDPSRLLARVRATLRRAAA